MSNLNGRFWTGEARGTWLHRLSREWYDDASEGLRQVPSTVVLWASGAVIVSVLDLPSPALMVAALALVTVAQVFAVLVPWPDWPRWVRSVPPLAQIIAVGLMHLSTGAAISTFGLLLLLPLLGLALQTGLVPLALGLVASGVVLTAPALAAVDRLVPLVYQLVIAMAVLLAVGTRAHGTVTLVRAQAQNLAEAEAEAISRARQLQASRDTLRSVMRAATEQAIMGTDETGAILSVSSGAQRMFARSEKELLSLHVTDVLRVAVDDTDGDAGTSDVSADVSPGTPGGVDVDPMAGRLSLLVGGARGGEAHMAELEDRDVDGSVRHLEYVVTARPLLEGADPELSSGYLFVVTDVTRRWEDERRQDEFISLVSHELRTPLVSILGYVELLRLEGTDLDEEQQEYLDVLERNAQRLRGLVDDLLASAQLVFGAPLSGARTDVVKVVQAAVKAQLPAARAADVEIRVEGDPVVPLVTDAPRVEQVVDNLVSNAVKYSPDGGRVTVTVRVGTTPEGGRCARIRVVDEGIGISPDELSQITQRFYRSNDSRRRRVRGVGLGLSLVQAVVQEHGGTLDISSEVGAGTQVEVVLPDLPLSSPDPTPDAAPPSAPKTSGREG